MENIKYKINLLKENYKYLPKGHIMCHILLLGYVMIQLKKKFKNKKQIIATKKWIANNREQYNEMKRISAKRKYNYDENYRKRKMKMYLYNKEVKRLCNILI